jgi:hypothetical protein
MFFCLLVPYTEKETSVHSEKESCAKKVCEYNAVVDQMLAVPKYDGNVDRDQEVIIPAKIIFP